MTEQTLTFRSGGLTLVGTLRTPDADPTGTVVVLVSGSGRIDRDSNDRRLRLGIARLLAEHLADHGVTSFRYDKRGVGESEGDFLAAGLHDNVADARAAVRAVRDHLGASARRVVAVGHSEGALAASAMVDLGELVDGVVLLSGTVRTGRQVLEWQAERVADLLPGVVRGLTRLLRVDVAAGQSKKMDRLAATTDDVVRQGPVRVNARWYREFMAFDPAPHLAAAVVPVLAITGSHDVQVDPADVDRMRALVPTPFEGHVVEGVNHILRAGDASPTTYRRQLDQPLDARVLALLTGWLLDGSSIADANAPMNGTHA